MIIFRFYCKSNHHQAESDDEADQAGLPDDDFVIKTNVWRQILDTHAQ